MNIVFQNGLSKSLSGQYFTPSRWREMVETAMAGQKFIGQKIRYYNVPCAFDIETTSFRSNGKPDGEKRAIMYEWTLGINGYVMIGRTWEEFKMVMDNIVTRLELDNTHRLMIYVHSLAYEFGFMRKHFKWSKVFAIESKKPVYAITDTGIEFRCSYLLTGYSLAVLGRNLTKYKVEKRLGDLDYRKIRHSGTPLTDEEIGYCINDVLVVMAHIQEQIEREKLIMNIPLTKTGYVRRYCRKACFYGLDGQKDEEHRKTYYHKMQGLRISPDEYRQLKRAFAGGYTHASAFNANKVMTYVTSYDFTSSYPAVMVMEKFPMSSSVVVTVKTEDEIIDQCKRFCCLFDLEIFDLESVFFADTYLSGYKCKGVVNGQYNNGRLVRAEHLYTTVTDVDFMILRKCYKWSHIKWANFRRYRRDYLPTDFVKAVLKLYGDKTTLKGVTEKQAEYLSSKEQINACYRWNDCNGHSARGI